MAVGDITINEGTSTGVAVDVIGTLHYGIVKLDMGTIGGTNPFSGTIPAVSNLAAGTVTRVEGGTIGRVGNVGTLEVGTISAMPNIPGGTIGLVTRVGNVGTVEVGTITTIPNIPGGTITRVSTIGTLEVGTISSIPNIPGGTLGLVTTVTNLSNGTIQNSGTTTGVGTVTNIGQLYNAGTVQNQLGGTITTLQNGTVVSNGGVQGSINPRSSKTIQTYGTTTTGTIGTLVAAQGAGTSIWVQSCDISSHNGTVDTVVSFGLASGGTSVVNRGNYGAQGGIAKTFPNPINGQVTNSALTWNVLGGSGTVSYNVTYFVEA